MGSIYSVGQVNSYIKNMFVQDALLRRINVRGEISNCTYHRTGHIYFSLKDHTGAISCVMFKGDSQSLTFRMQEGQKVVVSGNISVFERDGKYQLYAREIQLDGEGALYQQYMQLKRKLEALGLFSAEHKKPIPVYAGTIGIVTAPTGAAIRDIIKVSYRRNPYVQLILYPALVQGTQAAQSIVQGIRTLDAYGVDVIIVGRGGGSIEELWAFNEEPVARAIFACRTPVISAVGHETDTTIADLVADLRVPTPSAAAEQAVLEYRQLVNHMELLKNQLADRIEQKIHLYRQRLEHDRLRFLYAGPQHKLNEKKQYIAELMDRFPKEMQGKILDRKYQIGLLAERLDGISPLKKLQQGYSYTELSDGKAFRCLKQVEPGDMVTIHVTDGRVRARVEEMEALERNGQA
ncbi:MAG: exodeoxyribonuclease VII large subunit [Lachnospiraceae bacterium]|nr:exodeoxyribonuclease VII large subunit [Lachnospiraceae bacterium]